MTKEIRKIPPPSRIEILKYRPHASVTTIKTPIDSIKNLALAPQRIKERQAYQINEASLEASDISNTLKEGE